MNIFLTIDTEWDRSDKTKITTLNLASIHRFINLVEKYKLKAILFCSYEAIENDDFVQYIRPFVHNEIIEIGSHLHPWSNPPYFSEEEKKIQSFPSELDIELFNKKISSLTNIIEERLNVKPISYRAGRFGFSSEHIIILSKLGYKVDSSITPYVNWSKQFNMNKNIPDFSNYSMSDKFFIKDVNKDIRILEYPVSILKDYSLKGIVKKIIFNKESHRWFRILPNTNLYDLQKITYEYTSKGINNMVFMMHSNEFHYETNPYFNTKEKLDKMFSTMESFFQYINQASFETPLFNEIIEK